MKKHVLILLFMGVTFAGWAQRYDPEVDGPFFKYKPAARERAYQSPATTEEDEEETRSRKGARRKRKPTGQEQSTRQIPPAPARRQRCDESDQ